MSVQQQIQLAKTLPPRLIRFFQKYPPPALLKTPPTLESPAIETASTTSSSDPNVPVLETSSRSPYLAPSEASAGLPYHNPFLPLKSHLTGRWHSPAYGLRKQADLVKLAKAHGVLDLLPWTIKKPGEKEKRRIEIGLRVKGTGEGQKVKGKQWERTLKGRLEGRKKAMEGMGELVREWKQRGHGRGWKKWPSGKTRKNVETFFSHPKL